VLINGAGEFGVVQRAGAIHFFQCGLHPRHELPRRLAILPVTALESLSHLWPSPSLPISFRNFEQG